MEIDEARAGMAGLFQMMGSGPETIGSVDVTIPADGAELAARLYRPAAPPHSLIIYYHGGGWTLGTIDDYDGFARTLAEVTGSAVLLGGYRLAPEHPFPVPVNDASTILGWASDHCEALLGAALPVIVAGDSAGGALAATVARRARDGSGPAIAAQVLLCPVLQSGRRFASQGDPECQIVIGIDDMQWFWSNYAPNAADRLSPDAAPLLAASLSGLPPALIITAEYDVNRDEAEDYARQLALAGVKVRQARHTGEFHAFPVFLVLPASQAALAEVAEFLGELTE
jgi:acetyl esterase